MTRHRFLAASALLATIGMAACAPTRTTTEGVGVVPSSHPPLAATSGATTPASPVATSTPVDAATARATSSFRRTVLDDRVTRAHALDVAADGRVFFIEREGAIKVWDPTTRSTRMVGFIPVKAIHTSGLLGIALDPDFLANGWVYFYYSPYNDTENLLSRYTIRDGVLLPESRKVMLSVAVQRQVEGGHSAGSLAFAPDGSLFLSIGDNTSPRGHGWGPIDEREGRDIYDAQRASGNSWDLRGKILRIVPLPDGTYEIPAGNLFPHGTLGRPEIYVMGARNPYRFSIDPVKGWLYWGDVGPDAGMDDPARGPVGYDEFNMARDAGNYGWPYFIADNQAYVDYDFATETSKAPFDPRFPINDSPNNTGARTLPPARPALIWYPYTPTPLFPTLGTGGRAAMAGPVYRYTPGAERSGGLPATFDGALFAFDFMRHWIQEVHVDEFGALQSVQPFLEEMEFVRPMAMDVGPDGALYLIEWGESYEGWNNDDARLVRIEYVGPGGGSGARIDSAGPTEPIRRAEVGRTRSAGLQFAWPLEGGIFDFDRPVPYVVTGGAGGAAPAEVRVRGLLGHDSHTHPAPFTEGVRGGVTIAADESHLYMEDHFGAIEAWMGGAEKDPAVRVRLQPRRLEAEHVYAFGNATRRVQGSLRERIDVTSQLRVGDGGYARFGPVNLRNIESLDISVMPVAGGRIEVRIDGVSGPMLGEVEVPAAAVPAAPGAAPAPAMSLRVPVSDPGGKHDLYLVFRGTAGRSLMDVDWIEFNGPGMMQVP